MTMATLDDLNIPDEIKESIRRQMGGETVYIPSKSVPRQAIKTRLASGDDVKRIARDTGVSLGTVYNIRRGK